MPDTDQEQQEQDISVETEEINLLDQIIQEGKMVRGDAHSTQTTNARNMIGELVSQVLDGSMTVSNDTVAMINARIADIDKLLTDQLNAIMHTEQFQSLESS